MQTDEPKDELEEDPEEEFETVHPPMLGEIFLELGHVSPEDIESALARQFSGAKLGELLLEDGKINATELTEALALQDVRAAELTTVPRPRRWDVPFGKGVTDEEVRRMLSSVPFKNIDRSTFRSPLTLVDLLANDARIRHFEPGEIIVRTGDYGHSAFFLRKGEVVIDIDHIAPPQLGRRQSKRLSPGNALARLWARPGKAEVRSYSPEGIQTTVARKKDRGDEITARVFLQDFSVVFGEDGDHPVIHEGEWFGLLSAFGRTPRTATVIASEPETEVIEIRWQGLRDIMRKDATLRDHAEEVYRRHRLSAHLQSTPALGNVEPKEIERLAKATRFESHGRFGWFGSFKKLRGKSASDRLESEPVMLKQGDLPVGLILVASGFVRVTERYHDGERTLTYLGRGDSYGLQEILAGSDSRRPEPSRHTLRALGHVDALIIPSELIYELDIGRGASIPFSEDLAGEPQKRARPAVESGLLDFLVDQRFVNGTATMVIDLERCTRCDDCVRACAMTHGNNPRFVREGPSFGNLQIASACLHCRDPVCMIGCPTGAIHRDLVQGQIVINDMTCIGCSICAESCPYGTIRMVQVRNRDGEPIQDLESGEPIRKATKCDLCVDLPGGPACQNACGQDALLRVDMKELEGVESWLTR